jgi:hypothetical protein
LFRVSVNEKNEIEKENTEKKKLVLQYKRNLEESLLRKKNVKKVRTEKLFIPEVISLL